MPKLNAMKMTQLHGLLEPYIKPYMVTKSNKKKIDNDHKEQTDQIKALLYEYGETEIVVDGILVKLSSRHNADTVISMDQLRGVLMDKGENPDTFIKKGKISDILNAKQITELPL